MKLFDEAVVITGACGGIGRACARQLGRRSRLVLADINQAKLEAFAEALGEEGYDVADCYAGDLCSQGVADRLMARAWDACAVRSLVHTAGLSPSLATWDAILRANVLATEQLLLATEAQLHGPFAAVLMASMAGHMTPAVAELDAIFAAPLANDFLDRAEHALEPLVSPNDTNGLAAPAYGQSKRAVIRMCEHRAAAWGAQSARIMSISPGTIWTPMGRAEADRNPNAALIVQRTPAGRWGSPLDISAAVEFLTSDAAGFITGCDLRIDGGVTPFLRGIRL